MSQTTSEPGAFRELDALASAALARDPEAPWALVDVRSVEEFDSGHPAGAWNVPLGVKTWHGLVANPRFLEAMQALFARDDRLLLSCATGQRSRQACLVLGDAGFAYLVNVSSGFLGRHDLRGRPVDPGWQACGLPVENEAQPGRSWAAILARLESGPAS
ncbi:MAG: rhodanese-like domain-containing protein [Chloroflexi bacterium]|nr:rhodanese-like domain-containing protein [Chloroflexota bacterium]